MRRLKIIASLTIFLCIINLVGIVASFLALTDIWHAIEPDLSVEWWVVRISYFAEILLISSVVALVIIARKNPDAWRTPA
jgi:hypothetical protein